MHAFFTLRSIYQYLEQIGDVDGQRRSWEMMTSQKEPCVLIYPDELFHLSETWFRNDASIKDYQALGLSRELIIDLLALEEEFTAFAKGFDGVDMPDLFASPRWIELCGKAKELEDRFLEETETWPFSLCSSREEGNPATDTQS